MNKLLNVSFSSLLLISAPVSYASDSILKQYTYDMITQNVSKGFEPTTNSIRIDGSNIYVSYTTWADTAGSSDNRVVKQLGLDICLEIAMCCPAVLPEG